MHNERKSDDVEHHLHRYAGQMPDWLGRHVRGIASGTRWVRVPIALALILVGIFGLLPLIGFWMVPLGLLLLAIDLPFLARPMVALVLWIEERWRRWRGKKAEPRRLPIRRDDPPRP